MKKQILLLAGLVTGMVFPPVPAVGTDLECPHRCDYGQIGPGRHVQQFANLWRISGDFWDNWQSLNHNFDLFAEWLPENGPGHWADGDMIPFGHICQRNCDVKPDRWTRFTREEQLTLLSLWALAPSPLMLGMNLLVAPTSPRMSRFPGGTWATVLLRTCVTSGCAGTGDARNNLLPNCQRTAASFCA